MLRYAYIACLVYFSYNRWFFRFKYYLDKFQASFHVDITYISSPLWMSFTFRRVQTSRQTSFRPTYQTTPTYTLHASNANARGKQNRYRIQGVPQHIFLWAHSANRLSVTAPPPPSFKRNPILNFFLSSNQDELHVVRANTLTFNSSEGRCIT
jgi:hypothetical protein